jgi:hypothetical protein
MLVLVSTIQFQKGTDSSVVTVEGLDPLTDRFGLTCQWRSPLTVEEPCGSKMEGVSCYNILVLILCASIETVKCFYFTFMNVSYMFKNFMLYIVGKAMHNL